jgi:hypothetical protein
MLATPQELASAGQVVQRWALVSQGLVARHDRGQPTDVGLPAKNGVHACIQVSKRV